MTTLESIRLDPIMDVAERAGRGRAFYEIFPGTPASDGWLLDAERAGEPGAAADAAASLSPAFPGADLTMSAKQRDDQDVHKGVVEGDRPDDEQYWNANVPALNRNGLPWNLRSIAEDRIGANLDCVDAANADERGRTSDALRLELSALA